MSQAETEAVSISDVWLRPTQCLGPSQTWLAQLAVLSYPGVSKRWEFRLGCLKAENIRRVDAARVLNPEIAILGCEKVISLSHDLPG